jgi:hypothetical protein
MFANIKSAAIKPTTILFATAILLSSASAAPTTSLEPRTPAASGACYYTRPPIVSFAYASFSVHLSGTGQEDAGTCQGGFLDNLHGQCGTIENWGCSSDGQSVDVSFKVVAHPTPGTCVEQAIWLSQNHLNGVSCIHYGF